MKDAKNDNKQKISFFDVKELYDAAFAEKAKSPINLKKFSTLLAQAEQMQNAYIAQLQRIQETRYLADEQQAA